MSYDQNQRNAKRLICTRCGDEYDVTHAEKIAVYICVWCQRERATDVNGVPMPDP